MMPRRLPAVMRRAGLNSLEPNGRIGPSVVSVSAFHPLVPLLGFDAEGGDGAGFETADADRFVRLCAITVGAVIYPMERRFDLGDQFALARAGAQLDRMLCFERSAVREIRFEQTLFLQVLQRIRRLGQQLGSPAQQLLSKIFDLKRVHEFFSIGGMVTWR